MLRKGQASLYVGETSKSIYERGGEHQADMSRGVKEGHMWSHYDVVHPGETHPNFRFTVVKGARTALERQVREAVRIQDIGSVLNKRGNITATLAGW